MQSLLRDVLLSFCPVQVRRDYRPESPARVVRAATWTGLFQLLLFGYMLIVRYGHFLVERAKLWAPVLARTSDAFQSGTLIIVTLEFLLYPVSFLLLYFSLEGAARLLTGLVSSEVVPSLPVFLTFKIRNILHRRREAERVRQLPADTVTVLPNDRLRIATAHSRPAWSNPNLTIRIGGELYELERMDKGPLPRPFVYFLRRSPVGKILRGLEEYELPLPPQKN